MKGWDFIHILNHWTGSCYVAPSGSRNGCISFILWEFQSQATFQPFPLVGNCPAVAKHTATANMKDFVRVNTIGRNKMVPLEG